LFALLTALQVPTVPSCFKPPSKINHHFDWLLSIVLIRKMLNLNLLINFSIDPELYNQNENRVVLELPKPANETEFKMKGSVKQEETGDNQGKVTYIMSVLSHVLKAAGKNNESKKTVLLMEGATNITKIEKSIQEVSLNSTHS
jgi:hypothetical protein